MGKYNIPFFRVHFLYHFLFLIFWLLHTIDVFLFPFSFSVLLSVQKAGQPLTGLGNDSEVVFICREGTGYSLPSIFCYP